MKPTRTLKPTLTLVACALLAAGCTTLAPRAGSAGPEAAAMDAQALYRLGRSMHGQQKYGEALAAYAQVLAREPGHVDALNATGAIHSLLGDSRAAELAFRRAIAEAPGVSRSYNNLGFHLLRTGRPSEALTLFHEAKARAPRDEQVQVNIAMARADLAGTAPDPAPAAAPAFHESPRPTVALAQVNEGVYEVRSLPANAAAVAAVAAPAVAAPSPVPAATAFAAPQPARVEVSNGNGATGLARRVAQLVAPQSRLTNARPFNTAASRIQYTAGYEQAARDLGRRLPMAVPVVAVSRLDGANVRVLLGKDFPGTPAHVAIATGEQALPSHP